MKNASRLSTDRETQALRLRAAPSTFSSLHRTSAPSTIFLFAAGDWICSEIRSKTKLGAASCLIQSPQGDWIFVFKDLGTGWLNCDPDLIFKPDYYPLPIWISYWIPWKETAVLPVQWHALCLGLFASIIAPFGGSFASGFKRAFKIKDFGDFIPGHGGFIDKMDCQMVMAIFAYIYHQSFVVAQEYTVETIMDEAEMKRFTSVDTSVLKQHYEKKVYELELEKRVLQKEIEDLRQNLANLSSISDDGAQKLKEEYLQKLNVLEAQFSELKKKQDAQAQFLRQKQKSDEAAKRLQGSTPAEDQARIRAISAMEGIKRKRGSSVEDCKRCSAIRPDWQCYRCCVNCRCFLEISLLLR